MALPLPKVVADVGAGGGAVTAMGGMNALSNAMLDTQINRVKAQYAPLTTQAEAASKLAYANLMGPQFLAKLMGNPDVVANSPQLQDPATVARLYQAGMGGGTGNALMQMPNSQPQPPSNNSLSGWLTDKIKGITGGGAQPQSSNALTQPVDVNSITGTPGNSEIGQATAAWMKSPEASTQAQQEGMYSLPSDEQLLEWYRGKRQGQGANRSLAQPAYAENAANYAGIKEEGKEAGKLRAQDIKELNDTVFNADTKLATLDDINNMISSTEIRNIRQLPLLGRHEMGWYAKEGNPAEQQLVGRLYAQMGNVVKDSSRDFAGQFRKGEQQLLQGMKPNDSDTVDAMIGKAESLTVMTKLLRERSALTSQYMSQDHINKLDASKIADKQINGDAIRQNIHDKLNPTVTIKNRKTGETITIPASEARTKYGVMS
jgi:hypothetical protein